MTTFIREIYPVGHGGFAFESIGNYSIVFDCGSSSSPARVSQYINHLCQQKISPINRLYISHFDRDHVNGIRELINKVGVQEVVVPAIPVKYRVVYDVATRGAYSAILEMSSHREIMLVELESDDIIQKDIWEWVAKPMLCAQDWKKLYSNFEVCGLEIGRLNDPIYVDSVKLIINTCFKTAFGEKGPNSKGLLLLSQRTGGKVCSNELSNKVLSFSVQETAALYTGDANLIAPTIVNEVKSFLHQNLLDTLLLVQIPHHGSRYSSGRDFGMNFPATYYYYHGKSSDRLQKNVTFYQSLLSLDNLLELRDSDSDMIRHQVDFFNAKRLEMKNSNNDEIAKLITLIEEQLQKLKFINRIRG